MVVQLPELYLFSQRCTAPVYPESVIVPVDDPMTIGVVPVMLPPMEVGSMVTDDADEVF